MEVICYLIYIIGTLRTNSPFQYYERLLLIKALDQKITSVFAFVCGYMGLYF